MQHIAFDIGEVVMHIDFKPFFKVLMEDFRINELEIWEFLYDHEYTHNVGMLTLDQALRNRFYDKFGNGKIEEQFETILDAWNKSIYPNDTMINFILNLKNEGVKIAYLSNIGPEHARYLRTEFPEIFNNSVQHFSYEVGAAKPQMLYFQSFLLSNEDFAGCVYLDDRKANVVAAAKQRFDAMQFCLEDLKKPIDLKMTLDKIKDRLQKGW